MRTLPIASRRVARSVSASATACISAARHWFSVLPKSHTSWVAVTWPSNQL